MAGGRQAAARAASLAASPPSTWREHDIGLKCRWPHGHRLPQCPATRPARGVSSPFNAGGPGVSRRLMTLAAGSAMGGPQCGLGATLGPLEKPGGGHEPCSPGQRGPFLHCGYPAITASDVRPGSEPGAFRASRLCQPSCAGTARARGFCAPAAGAGQATGEGALAARRRRGSVQRDRLRGQACYPGRPAVGTGAETARRGLVAAGSSTGSACPLGLPARWVCLPSGGRAGRYVVQAGSARAGLPRQRSTELVRSSGRPGESCPGCLAR
jgi:hypothetical protein